MDMSSCHPSQPRPIDEMRGKWGYLPAGDNKDREGGGLDSSRLGLRNAHCRRGLAIIPAGWRTFETGVVGLPMLNA